MMLNLIASFLFSLPLPVWRDAPMETKLYAVYVAGELSLTHVAAELPAFQDFDGVIYIWRARWAGEPVPEDPIFGKK